MNTNHAMNTAEYSANSIVVYGDTFPYKDTLKKLGGKFNPNLKGENIGLDKDRFAGWIFSKKHEETVMDFVQNTNDFVKPIQCQVCQDEQEICGNCALEHVSCRCSLVHGPRITLPCYSCQRTEWEKSIERYRSHDEKTFVNYRGVYPEKFTRSDFKIPEFDHVSRKEREHEFIDQHIEDCIKNCTKTLCQVNVMDQQRAKRLCAQYSDFMEEIRELDRCGQIAVFCEMLSEYTRLDPDYESESDLEDFESGSESE